MEKEKKVLRRRRQEAQEWGGKAPDNNVITKIHKRKEVSVNVEAAQEAKAAQEEANKVTQEEVYKAHSMLPISPQSKRNIAIEVSNAVVHRLLEKLEGIKQRIAPNMSQSAFYDKVRILQDGLTIRVALNDVDVLMLVDAPYNKVRMYLDVSRDLVLDRVIKNLEQAVYYVYYKGIHTGVMHAAFTGELTFTVSTRNNLPPTEVIQSIEVYFGRSVLIKAEDEEGAKEEKVYGIPVLKKLEDINVPTGDKPNVNTEGADA